MNREDALRFLRAHQPLPDTLDGSTHETLREVWSYFHAHPDLSAVPLWLNAFGEGDAGGIYQRVEDLLRPFPSEAIVPQLLRSLESPRRPQRYWAAQFAAVFPSEQLVEPLTRLLGERDSDVQVAAGTALAQIGTPSAWTAIERAAKEETDPESARLLWELLEERG